MHKHLLCLFCKKLLLAPINLLLQELSKSNAQTSNDTKQGEKEESLTEARIGRILSNGKLDQIKMMFDTLVCGLEEEELEVGEEFEIFRGSKPVENQIFRKT